MVLGRGAISEQRMRCTRGRSDQGLGQGGGGSAPGVLTVHVLQAWARRSRAGMLTLHATGMLTVHAPGMLTVHVLQAWAR